MVVDSGGLDINNSQIASTPHLSEVDSALPAIVKMRKSLIDSSVLELNYERICTNINGSIKERI